MPCAAADTHTYVQYVYAVCLIPLSCGLCLLSPSPVVIVYSYVVSLCTSTPPSTHTHTHAHHTTHTHHTNTPAHTTHTHCRQALVPALAPSGHSSTRKACSELYACVDLMYILYANMQCLLLNCFAESTYVRTCTRCYRTLVSHFSLVHP